MNEPQVITKGTFYDNRGFFQEVAKEGDGILDGIGTIRQINMSRSSAGVLRGIHAQTGMAKAMWVVSGAAKIVAVNLDAGSKDFGKSVSHTMKIGDGKVFYAPDYYGRGFLALEDNTVVVYACSDVYRPGEEYGVNPLSCNIDWGNGEFIISEKDKSAKNLMDFWKEQRRGS